MHTAVAGVRNSDTGDPITVDTVMHIGSITKIFTATLLMQLVDDGLVALEDPVTRHLPDLRLRDASALERITCKMLLNHTSGIDGVLLPDHGPDQERIEDAIARFAALGQVHAPGGGPSYCNAAAVISGYLSQRLRGQSWYTLIKTRILQPLGLEHSLVEVTDTPLFRVSVGDVTDPATGRVARTTRPFLPVSFAPAGATMMASATDLVEFGRAHINGGVGANGTRILSQASCELMRRKTADLVEPMGLSWGLGWVIAPGGLFGHGGGAPGARATFFIHPASGRALAFQSNSDRGEMVRTSVVDPLLMAWSGGGYPLAPTKAPEPGVVIPFDVEAYLGTYRNNMELVRIVRHDGGLGVQMAATIAAYDNTRATFSEVMPLTALGEHRFLLSDEALRFLPPDIGGTSPGLALWSNILVRAST
jgi:CubicO group peptidase (beta-lactamase class C family)